MVLALIVPVKKTDPMRHVNLEEVKATLPRLSKHVQSNAQENCALFFYFEMVLHQEINENILELRDIVIRGECIVLKEQWSKTEEPKLVDCNQLPARTPFEKTQE